MILLTDEQINQAWPDDIFTVNDLYTDILQHTKAVCAAQLRRVVEWLESPCTEHEYTKHYHTEIQEPKTYFHDHHRDCPKCMENLKREVCER